MDRTIDPSRGWRRFSGPTRRRDSVWLLPARLLQQRRAEVPEKDDVKIVIYPRHKSFFGSVFAHRSPDNSDKEAVGQTLARILEVVQPVARQSDAAGIKGNQVQDEVLRMVQFEEGK
jgi:hypothetical protein